MNRTKTRKLALGVLEEPVVHIYSLHVYVINVFVLCREVGLHALLFCFRTPLYGTSFLKLPIEEKP